LSSDVKKQLAQFREGEKDAKTEDELIDELGQGVEPEPKEPDKPDLDSIPNLDLSSADDVRDIFDALKLLPSIKEVGDQLTKHDAYQVYARKIWKIKQSEREVFDIKMRVVERIEEHQRSDGVTIQKMIWKRDNDGQIMTTTKKFKYVSATIQEKDEFIFLEGEKQDTHFALIEEGARVDRIIANTRIHPDTEEDSYSKYASNRTWQNKHARWQKAVQDYWVAVFKAYFGATDEDIKSIVFDDIINYSEVALYKGGVKSPK